MLSRISEPSETIVLLEEERKVNYGSYVTGMDTNMNSQEIGDIQGSWHLRRFDDPALGSGEPVTGGMCMVFVDGHSEFWHWTDSRTMTVIFLHDPPEWTVTGSPGNEDLYRLSKGLCPDTSAWN